MTMSLTSNKNPACEGSGRLPWLATLHGLFNIFAGRILSYLCYFLERGQLETHTWSPSTLPYPPYSFANLNPYSFTVINHNHVYDSVTEFCESLW